MHPGDVIPLSRTGSPYSLNEAVNDLTTNVAATDTDSLNQSLDTLSATLDQIAPQLGPTFDGLTRLSRSLNSRSETLGELLQATPAMVTEVLAERSQQVNTLILNANDLLGGAGRTSGGHQRAARQHRRGREEPHRAGQGQRGRTGPDARSTQRRDRDAGEESRQPVQGAAGAEEVRDDHQRSRSRAAPTTAPTCPISRSPSCSSRSSTTRSASAPAIRICRGPCSPGRATAFREASR